MRLRLRSWLVAVTAVGSCVTLVAGTAAAAPAVSQVDLQSVSSMAAYRFHSENRALLMDARFSGGHGTVVQLWSDNLGDAQLWVAETAREGGEYLHPAYNQALCLDFNGERRHGAPILVNNCDGSDSQRWFYFSQGPGRVDVATHADHAFCIDIPNSNFAVGQALQLWDCNNSIAQRWTF